MFTTRSAGITTGAHCPATPTVAVGVLEQFTRRSQMERRTFLKVGIGCSSGLAGLGRTVEGSATAPGPEPVHRDRRRRRPAAPARVHRGVRAVDPKVHAAADDRQLHPGPRRIQPGQAVRGRWSFPDCAAGRPSRCATACGVDLKRSRRRSIHRRLSYQPPQANHDVDAIA